MVVELGLDMYLYAESYIGRWQHSSDEERSRADQALEAGKLSHLQEENAGVKVVATVGYWRKANQIHHWFVENVQHGVDDCGRYSVSSEQLEELREKCILVLAASEMVPDNVSAGRRYEPSTGEWREMMERGEVILNPKVAEAELPSADGFFFGNTDYDQWYVDDLIRTLEIVEKVLPEYRPSGASGAGFIFDEEGIRDLRTGESLVLPDFEIYYESSW